MLKKISASLLAILLAFSLASCANSGSVEEIESDMQTTETVEVETTQADTESDTTNILIAYFSRAGENYNVGVVEKGNTEIIAEMIANETGGDLFKIETVETYPDTYDECTKVAQQEQNENARPELLNDIDNLDDYDVIFLGYPIWWGDMPMAVYTFLEGHDFEDKTILPFCTNEGSGLSTTVSSIENETAAEVLEGLSIRGSVAQNSQEEAEDLVKDWLSKLSST